MSSSESNGQELLSENKAANRSANLGCLILVVIAGILLFSFGLGGYSAYRLHSYRQELILQHLEQALLGEIRLNGSSPAEAMRELKEKTVQADPWFKAVPFNTYDEKELKTPQTGTPFPVLQPVTLQVGLSPASAVLQSIEKLTGGTIEIIDGSINLLPANETLEPRKLLNFKEVAPDFWKESSLVQAPVPAEFWDIKPLLLSSGLPFPPRSYARYYPDQRRVEISNLKKNNEKISTWLKEKGVVPSL
jgi:hypothetical protein